MPDTTTTPKDREAAMAERFARDTASHELTVVRDDGLYRHLKARSAKPGEGWCNWFEVVTWPGRLVVTGDCGTYVFSRLDDMFEFFRIGFDGRINPGYWSEKTPGGARSCKSYSEDAFREQMDAWLADYEQDYTGTGPSPAHLRKLVKVHDLTSGFDHETYARELLDQIEAEGAASDVYEWDLHDWDWQFLWCCHAIVWAIAHYDAEMTPRARRRPLRRLAELLGLASEGRQ